MTIAKRRAYMRKWRAKHPHYSRDWQRKFRGSKWTAGIPGCKVILGVRVKV